MERSLYPGILVFFLLSLLFPFVSHASGTVRVEGVLQHPLSDTLYLSSYNYIARYNSYHKIDTTVLGEGGTFSFNVPCSGHELLLVDNGFLPVAALYVQPGDSLVVSADLKGFPREISVTIGGKGALRSQFYADRGRILFDIASDSVYKTLLEQGFAGLAELGGHMNRQRELKIAEFEEYFANEDIYPDFRNNFQRRLLYDWAALKTYAIRTAYSKALQGGAKEEAHKTVGRELMDFLTEVKLDGSDVVVYEPGYEGFIQQYTNMLGAQRYYSALAPGQHVVYTDWYREQYRIATQTFTGRAKDIAIVSTIENLLKSDTAYRGDALPLADSLVAAFATTVTDSVRYTDIYKYYDRYKGKVAKQRTQGTFATDFLLPDINGKPFLLSNYKGKVVYIDFWGTWCGPCIQEIPHAKKLRTKLAGEEVVFVYIAYERDNYDGWKAFVEEHEMGGVQLYMNQNEPFTGRSPIQQFNVSSFPTYVLIGRDGAVISADAMRPSNDGAEQQIRQALNTPSAVK